MCSAGRGAADMSQITNRASTMAAVISIVLLLVFLVILWTGVRTKQDAIERKVNDRLDTGAETLDRFLADRSNQSSTTAKIMFDEESFSNEETIDQRLKEHMFHITSKVVLNPKFNLTNISHSSRASSRSFQSTGSTRNELDPSDAPPRSSAEASHAETRLGTWTKRFITP
ncbi:hypothetical protein WN48_00881 [Eufriesea mexicana]|nr:hypothetical protein WN48_00881 [Eufriesea mexicana]